MLDRASTFANSEIVKLLKTRFIPVAIDQAYHRRQQDAEGDFYRKIAGQGPFKNFRGTTQGLYAATADGRLLFYNNNRGPERIIKLLNKAATAQTSSGTKQIVPGKLDARYHPTLPPGGLVVRVRARVLGGYEPTTDPWRQIFQSSTSRDNLWISKSEHQALSGGDFPMSLQQRIAKFHLVDNTRGEPPMWNDPEIRQLNLKITDGVISGSVHLETKDGKRGYQAELLGRLETKNGKVTRFDLVAKGEFWGQGPYTTRAPEGKFPLAVSFTLADGTDVADGIAPQGSRGWMRGYIR